jgi:hypothetical protein
MGNPEDFGRWLLGSTIPSIRYRTLRRLLDRPQADPDVRRAQAEMRSQGPVPAILANQTQQGSWRGDRGYYSPKYTSTHWSLLLLAELEADAGDARLPRGADFMLKATERDLERGQGRGRGGISCFWGNLLRYSLHAGLVGDPRLQPVVGYLVRDALAGDWRCGYSEGLPCAWGAARGLWGLAALPGPLRSPEVEQAIAQGLAFLLERHRLAEADYPAADGAGPLWFRLNFPLFYQADILFVLGVLSELGALGHPEAQPALAWLTGKRLANGRWRGTSPLRRWTYAELGGREETDRWVSLQSAILLRQAQAATH